VDGVQWAGHQSLKASADEVKYINAGFGTPANLFASGPKLLGEKYMTTRADGNLIIGKHGTHGFVAVKSAKCFVICSFDETTVTPAQANIATQNFADYMKGLGF